MNFWDSKLIKDIENGKLPQVPVVIEPSSILYLSLALLIVSIIIMLFVKIFKNF